MFPRVSALLPLRPLSRVPLPRGSPEASEAAILPLAAPRGTVRTKNIQRYFGTSNMINRKNDEKSGPADKISKTPSKNQDIVKEDGKKDILGIIKGMKVELSTVCAQTTKPPSRKPLRNVGAVGKPLRAPEDASEKRNEPLSPALVAAASAVAASLPFDKQMTKSELLTRLQQHEQYSVSQKQGEKAKISFSNIISDMKVARSAKARTSRPEHQIQFDEGFDSSLGREIIADLKKSLKKDLFKGKRLNIFDMEQFTEEAPQTETSPSLWDVEFAKQLATVNEQPFQNGFEEMIQWTKEGKLWEYPINNEAGFDDDGSEFHEHIFLDKYLEDFPKQGPIRHFMELVTCGLSKNPYLSVKQKVEHIEWFRNYFKDKRDILKENNIQFN
ncbi:28S ribosomal protein S31, mitochondrial [Heterocephalus glaber]|nr:28S ribosomal protein S31, mitochondrial isoform X1 [Heterocephalus glaber]EHB05819.1 28S ribosomal protein S31, mitochondrial [Heterocephalus glaber]